MKLKEFMETEVFKLANIVVYYDINEDEIEPTTEVQRRKMLNMEVEGHGTMIERNGLVTLEVFLK